MEYWGHEWRFSSKRCATNYKYPSCLYVLVWFIDVDGIMKWFVICQKWMLGFNSKTIFAFFIYYGCLSVETILEASNTQEGVGVYLAIQSWCSSCQVEFSFAQCRYITWMSSLWYECGEVSVFVFWVPSCHTGLECVWIGYFSFSLIHRELVIQYSSKLWVG